MNALSPTSVAKCHEVTYKSWQRSSAGSTIVPAPFNRSVDAKIAVQEEAVGLGGTNKEFLNQSHNYHKSYVA
jgi:hypothetical protein